jgi:vitamin B12 transporter
MSMAQFRPTVLFLAAAASAAAARAQAPAPVSESVVVSASLAPENEPAVSGSVTVLTREDIEKSGKTSVVDLLRRVPGLDVAQNGGRGSVASVFLRGANSTQALVLLDGVRVNRVDFSGYDFSQLSVENVERIEVARGPFSALYGSDALGGVVSIVTRAASREPEGQVSAAFGNRSSHEETLHASAGAGDFALAVSGRDVADGGDPQQAGGTRVDHNAWRDRNGSARLDWTPSDEIRVGAEVSRKFGRTEIPTDGASPTPRRFTDFAETDWIVPATWKVSPRNTLQGSLSQVDSHPTFSDPDDPFDYTFSDTRLKSQALRLVDAWALPGHTVSATASYERSRADLTDSFGVELDGRKIHTWGAALEDQAPIASGRLLFVAGVRYDRHSAFGESVSPRVSLVWKVGEDSAARASWGTGFRAPSLGELYYPEFGNPDLKPERSKSFEVGYTLRSRPLDFDVALFRSDFRNLIAPNFANFINSNIGRARTQGIETSASLPAGETLKVRVSYTWLDAKDESTGLALLRRPRHRGCLEADWWPSRWRLTASALLVGRRADVDSATFSRIEDPSYVRFDARVSCALGHFTPFLRAENLSDRRYAEIDGYPAPRRRIAAGISAAF